MANFKVVVRVKIVIEINAILTAEAAQTKARKTRRVARSIFPAGGLNVAPALIPEHMKPPTSKRPASHQQMGVRSDGETGSIGTESRPARTDLRSTFPKANRTKSNSTNMTQMSNRTKCSDVSHIRICFPRGHLREQRAQKFIDTSELPYIRWGRCSRSVCPRVNQWVKRIKRAKHRQKPGCSHQHVNLK